MTWLIEHGRSTEVSDIAWGRCRSGLSAAPPVCGGMRIRICRPFRRLPSQSAVAMIKPCKDLERARTAAERHRSRAAQGDVGLVATAGFYWGMSGAGEMVGARDRFTESLGRISGGNPLGGMR